MNESRQQTAPRSREKQGFKGSWVPVGRQHATGNHSVQPSVVKTTDHGQVVQHVQEVRPRGGGVSEAGDEGLTVIQEVHSRTGVKVKGWKVRWWRHLQHLLCNSSSLRGLDTSQCVLGHRL